MTDNQVTLSQLVTINVRILLSLHRMTQHDLAAATGLSLPTVAQRLSDRRPWNLQDLGPVAAALKVEPADLLRPVYPGLPSVTTTVTRR